ncbi:sensor histidine kinase [Pollutimonas subterranea]|nr:PhnD/SsuA/transferrin family substrate-binding protein [Pollutimonas subterranea]
MAKATRPGRLSRLLSLLILSLTATQLSTVQAVNTDPAHEPLTAHGQPIQASPASDATPSINAPASVVRVGVLAYMGTAHAAQEWSPVQQFLQTALPAYQVEFVYLDLNEIADAAVGSSINFVLTNPGHYVTLELSVGASRIVTVEQGRNSINGLSLGSAVIARADREDLINLEDLPGHTLVATAHDGFGGYQTVWRELAALGIDPESDLEAKSFVDFPMSRVLDAVADGRADAGILRACVLEDIPDWRDRYKVLSPQPDTGFGCAVSTRLYPDWPLATLPHTPPELARDVAITLLQMPATTGGLRFTVPADYQSVHDLFRELQIGPYAYLKEQGVAALARRHWPVLALLGVLVLLWLLYTFRVEKLVHARTRALRETLEERKQIEARMRASQESVDHLARLSILGELSTTLAHELSQPLASMANYGRSLLRRLDSGRLDDDAVRLAATEIAQQAQHAANVLSRIRAFARKRVSIRQDCRPIDVVSCAVSLFCGMLSETPQINIDDQLSQDIKVKIDKSQIQQVLLNLMKNSMDAMRGIEPDKRHIDITLAQQGTDIFIHVRDYGSGLSNAQQAQLFEPFYTEKPDGLGLGLSISYSIIEAHGGTITASTPCDGKGMILSLSLPILVQDTNTSEHIIKPS